LWNSAPITIHNSDTRSSIEVSAKLFASLKPTTYYRTQDFRKLPTPSRPRTFLFRCRCHVQVAPIGKRLTKRSNLPETSLRKHEHIFTAYLQELMRSLPLQRLPVVLKCLPLFSSCHKATAIGRIPKSKPFLRRTVFCFPPSCMGVHSDLYPRTEHLSRSHGYL
jgi:hypothetical protein